MAAPRITRGRLKTVDLAQYFTLPCPERIQVESMMTDQPQALIESKFYAASKAPTGSRPTGISKTRGTNYDRAKAHLALAQKFLDAAKEDSPNGEPPTVWVKKDGLKVSTGVPVIPQGVTDGQIGKTFPPTTHNLPAGIINTGGYRCYRSALLQCLFHTPEFYHLLGILHRDCKRTPTECITCALQQMTQDYWNSDPRNTKSNSDILEQALKHNITEDETIQNDEQSDAHDLLLHFISFLEQDAYGVDPVGRQSPAPLFDETNGSNLTLPKMFSFEYDVWWTCEECGKEHPKEQITEQGLELLVYNTRAAGETLESYFEDSRSDPFEDTKPFRCDSQACRAKQRTHGYKLPEQSKQRRISHAPEILVIRLRRFKGRWSETRRRVLTTKYQQAITCGTQLDLTYSSSWKVDDIRYDLRGVVSHRGSTIESGHYVAGVCQRSPENTYCTVNDLRVSRPTQDPVPVTGDAYLLIYSRIEAEVEDEDDNDGDGDGDGDEDGDGDGDGNEEHDEGQNEDEEHEGEGHEDGDGDADEGEGEGEDEDGNEDEDEDGGKDQDGSEDEDVNEDEEREEEGEV